MRPSVFAAVFFAPLVAKPAAAHVAGPHVHASDAGLILGVVAIACAGLVWLMRA